MTGSEDRKGEGRKEVRLGLRKCRGRGTAYGSMLGLRRG